MQNKTIGKTAFAIFHAVVQTSLSSKKNHLHASGEATERPVLHGISFLPIPEAFPQAPQK